MGRHQVLNIYLVKPKPRLTHSRSFLFAEPLELGGYHIQAPENLGQTQFNNGPIEIQGIV